MSLPFDKVIEQRRAVNFFDTTKDIPDALLRKIIEMAAKTPSSFNLQPWQVIVLRDKDEKLKLQKLAMNQPKVSEAPVTLIVLADNEGWKDTNPFVERTFQEMIKAGSMTEKQWNWFTKTTARMYGSKDETSIMFACKNTGFFAMALMLAAKSEGVDSHPMDGFNHDGVMEAFNIPNQYRIPLLISLGYFDTEKELHPPKWRKSYDDIVVSF